MKRRNTSYTVEREKRAEKASVWVIAIPIIRRAEECFCARATRDVFNVEKRLGKFFNKSFPSPPATA